MNYFPFTFSYIYIFKQLPLNYNNQQLFKVINRWQKKIATCVCGTVVDCCIVLNKKKDVIYDNIRYIYIYKMNMMCVTI